MNAKANAKAVVANDGRMDVAKWLIVAVLVAVAVVGNWYFSAQPLLYRVVGVLVFAGAALLVAARTAKGRTFLAMMKEARIEIRKVVWPTRQEITNTTLIVVGVVVVMALLLWAFDTLFGWLVSLIVG